MVTTRFPTRNLTYNQIVAAIEDNSYPTAIGTFFDPNNGAACAIGQGALNTGTDEASLSEALMKSGVSKFVFNLNDNRKLTPQQVAQRMRELPQRFQDMNFKVNRKDWGAIFPAYRGVTVPRGAVAARS